MKNHKTSTNPPPKTRSEKNKQTKKTKKVKVEISEVTKLQIYNKSSNRSELETKKKGLQRDQQCSTFSKLDERRYRWESIHQSLGKKKRHEDKTLSFLLLLVRRIRISRLSFSFLLLLGIRLGFLVFGGSNPRLREHEHHRKKLHTNPTHTPSPLDQTDHPYFLPAFVYSYLYCIYLLLFIVQDAS